MTRWFGRFVCGVPRCGPWKNRGAPRVVGSSDCGQSSTRNAPPSATLPATSTVMEPLCVCSPARTSSRSADASSTSARSPPITTTSASRFGSNRVPWTSRMLPGQPSRGETSVTLSFGCSGAMKSQRTQGCFHHSSRYSDMTTALPRRCRSSHAPSWRCRVGPSSDRGRSRRQPAAAFHVVARSGPSSCNRIDEIVLFPARDRRPHQRPVRERCARRRRGRARGCRRRRVRRRAGAARDRGAAGRGVSQRMVSIRGFAATRPTPVE